MDVFLEMFLAFLLLGVVIAFIVSKTRRVVEQRSAQSEILKKCPYCAERIRVEAIRCRFCHADLTLGSPSAMPAVFRKRRIDKERQESTRKSDDGKSTNLSEIRNPRLWAAIAASCGVMVWGGMNYYTSRPATVTDVDAPEGNAQSVRAHPPALKETQNSPIPSAAPQPGPQAPPTLQIAKRDGTVDPRRNDLDELCKDWVYYRTKVQKHTREGDIKSAARARAAFADINGWLSAYKDDDVYSACSKYDTPDFINRYR